MKKIRNEAVRQQLDEIMRKIRGETKEEEKTISAASFVEDISVCGEFSMEETVPPCSLSLIPADNVTDCAIIPEDGVMSIESDVVLGDVIEGEIVEFEEKERSYRFLSTMKVIVCVSVLLFSFFICRTIYRCGTSVSEAQTVINNTELVVLKRDIPEAAEAPEIIKVAEAPEIVKAPEVPEVPEIVKVPEVPEESKAPEDAEVPGNARISEDTSIPDFSEASEVSPDPVEEILFSPAEEESLEALEREIQESIRQKEAVRDTIRERDIKVLEDYISAVREGNTAVTPEEIHLIAESTVKYAKQYKLPLGLVVAVMQTESGFRPSASSSADARGLMQVMWKYHYGRLQAVGIMTQGELHDIEKGIQAGCIVLAGYMKEQKSITGSLGRYYGALQQPYVSTVKAYWETFDMVKAGILDEAEWKSAVEKTRGAWNRLFGKSPAPSKAVSKPKTVPVVSNNTNVESKKEVPVKSASSIVFKNHITVEGKDGTIKRWTDGDGK